MIHEGVGVLISNQAGDLFFVQEKDQCYPIKKWVGAYSPWGGKMEAWDTDMLKALMRELGEELQSEINLSEENFRFVGKFLIESDNSFVFHLFTLMLNHADFKIISASNVLEGKGVIKSKDELLTGNWIWGLEQVIYEFFSLKSK